VEEEVFFKTILKVANVLLTPTVIVCLIENKPAVAPCQIAFFSVGESVAG
jgi:hypothetical protein